LFELFFLVITIGGWVNHLEQWKLAMSPVTLFFHYHLMLCKPRS